MPIKRTGLLCSYSIAARNAAEPVTVARRCSTTEAARTPPICQVAISVKARLVRVCRHAASAYGMPDTRSPSPELAGLWLACGGPG